MGSVRNILPMIGFIIITVMFFLGLAMARTRKARKLLNERKTLRTIRTQAEKPSLELTGNEYILNSYPVDESRELPTEGVEKLTIISVFSELNIYYSDEDKILVKYYGSAQSEEKEKVPFLEAVKEGREAIVRIKYPIWHNIRQSEKTALDVTIPANMNCDLDIRNASGGIYAKELKGGNIKINTVSGEISLSRVKGTDVEIESASGSITVGDIDASGKFACDTLSGKCTVGTVTGFI